MICISVTPQSRKFAKVDLLNAARQCDLVELCLDRLIKKPDVADLVAATDKSVLISCRRQEDGGGWIGSEEDRLRLLRQAIACSPAYVELELDIAGEIRRYGETQRVVSYTSLDEPIGNVDDIYDRARNHGADVVKFSWPTRTLDAMWPLLVAVTKHRNPPIVGTGLGRSGLMFSLLGRKSSSPWIYAALEKGMEAYPGQPTIRELDDIYRWRDINAKTRFAGVCGFGAPETKTIQVFNAGFDEWSLNGRCLPLAWGRLDRFGPMLDALKIRSLIVSPALGPQLCSFADTSEDAVRDSGDCDLLVWREGAWQAFNTVWRSVLKCTEQCLAGESSADRPLDRQSVLIIGATGRARSVAFGFRRRNCVISISDPDDNAAAKVAQTYGLRHVPFTAVYDSYADVLAMIDPAIPIGYRKNELNPSILKPGMTVVDVSQLPDDGLFGREARERACRVVEPRDIFSNMVRSQFHAVTGKELPAAALNVLETEQ